VTKVRAKGRGVGLDIFRSSTEAGLARPKDVRRFISPDQRQRFGEVNGRTRRRVESGAAKGTGETGRQRG
jgi:hypothetical protein